MATNHAVAWSDVLLEQLDFFWDLQARPRLEGLTDEEYFWEPVPDSWSLRPTATGDLIMDSERGEETAPDPVTTIAWRLAHIVVHILKARTHRIFGNAADDPADHVFAGTAATALRQLDDAYLHWKTGLAGLPDRRLAEPIGTEERYFEGRPLATLILHVNREVLSHIAEIALLRDLYARGSLRSLPLLGLRALVADDAERLADWGMDERFRAAAEWADRDHDQYLRFHQDLIKRIAADPRRLAVTDRGSLVGYVDFTLDDDGSCELGIAIGPSTRWGQRLGRQAISLAARHARNQYAATRVWARTHSTNTAARRMLIAAGFVEVGPCGAEDYRGRSATMIRYDLPAELLSDDD